jgi:hypothetical protein
VPLCLSTTSRRGISSMHTRTQYQMRLAENFQIQLLYRYCSRLMALPLDRRLGGPKKWSAHTGREEKRFSPNGIRITAIKIPH